MHPKAEGAPKEAPGYNSSIPARGVIIVLECMIKAPKDLDPIMARITPLALRFYRRHLTQFTPECRQSPSCSEHAVAWTQALGWRRGLRFTLERMGACL